MGFGERAVVTVRGTPSGELFDRAVEAAADAFVECGFRATTLSLIAARSGLPVETLVSVGTKTDLALAAYKREALPADWSQIMAIAGLRRAIDQPDNETAIAMFVDYWASTVDRHYRLWLAAKAAVSQEPRAAGAFAEALAARRNNSELLAGILIGRGVWPLDSDRSRLAARLGAMLSVETYSYLLDVWKCSPAEYREYLADALTYSPPLASRASISSDVSSLAFDAGESS